MCLLAALAFGGVMASWATDSGLGGANSLTVNTVASDADDLTNANVTVNVYKIADGAYTSGFEYIPQYKDFASKYNLDDMTGSRWQDMANEAEANLGSLAPAVKNAPAGEAITGLSDGLYLVVAPAANSATSKYTFNPTVVALPTKKPLTDDQGNVIVDEDGFPIIKTSVEYGDWVTEADITLKYTKEPLYGSIKVIKQIDNFSGEPASFTFHINGKTPSGAEYDNVLMVYYDGGESCEAVDTHIPAGTKVKVTEAYESNRFERVDADTSEKVIIADEFVTENNPMAQAIFKNHQTTEIPQGHGVQNNFEYTQENGDWEWHIVPEEDKVEK